MKYSIAWNSTELEIREVEQNLTCLFPNRPFSIAQAGELLNSQQALEADEVEETWNAAQKRQRVGGPPCFTGYSGYSSSGLKGPKGLNVRSKQPKAKGFNKSYIYAAYACIEFYLFY